MTPDNARASALQAAAAKGLQRPRFDPEKPMTPLQAKCWQAEMRKTNMGDKF